MKDLSIIVDDIKFNYRVAIIFECAGKILVEVNPEVDYVVIPGGRVKVLENSLEALKRETNEELGYDLNIDNIKLKMMIENFFIIKDVKYHEMGLIYIKKINEDSILYTEKLTNKDSINSYYEWVSINKINEINLLPTVIKDNILNKEFVHVIVNELEK